ncbi:opioid-binding protein/cell adhesion molecule-like [Hoplias malabaricus]|uniref:opioid-binding protein/cell adhesion molecule-like n=1 Tax=Hoplias malabaricus TaxID=27720 RepID=UPI003463309E
MHVFVLFVFLFVLGLEYTHTVTEECPFKKPLTLFPETLLVKYGEPAKVTCSINVTADHDEVKWEAALGDNNKVNDTSVFWNVSSLTQWDVNNNKIFCYVNVKTADGSKQCKAHLKITLYKPPDSVMITSERAEWSEGQKMVLRCSVLNVGPVQNLTVQWIRFDESIYTKISKSSMYPWNLPISGDMKGSVNVTDELEVEATRDKDGAQYQCKTLLTLEGLQHPEEGASELVNISVHYKPIIYNTTVGTVSRTKGDRLELECRAGANPSAEIIWLSPENTTFTNTSTLVIAHVQKEHQGHYVCFASNKQGNDSVSLTLLVEEDYLPIIASCAAAAVLILVIVLCACFCRYYRHTHMGQYILKSLNYHKHSSNVAHGDMDHNQL